MFDVIFEVRGLPAMNKAALNRMHKRMWHSIGLFWRRRFLPRHFVKRWQVAYGFTPRKGERIVGDPQPRPRSYAGRKKAQGWGTVALIRTGDSARRTKSQKKVTSTRERVRVIMPQGWNRRPAGGKVRMADEVRTVLPIEKKELGARGKVRMESMLARSGHKRRIKIA